ncbi:MAG: RNA polymerase sigma factor [Clostridia bacterium]|nr:RNA polymerase sigma factor [Clostridia bacterium]
MQNLSAGNINNIETIVNTYGDMLYRICYVILKSEGDAEDVVQETIIKYFEKKPSLKDYEHTKAWLITVAKNKSKDLLRYKQRHSHINIDDMREVPTQASENGILEMLMTLPEKFCLVLMLYYVEGYSIEEIAKIVGKTPSAVKMRLSKGRKLLKEKYRKEVLNNGI